jgi:hypothetical protein
MDWLYTFRVISRAFSILLFAAAAPLFAQPAAQDVDLAMGKR